VLVGDRRRQGLRYIGSIASLFELIALLEDAELRTELLPGPTPDVTIAVETDHLHDGTARMHRALDHWHADRTDESATLLPRWLT
jgi:hypothetical protein